MIKRCLVLLMGVFMMLGTTQAEAARKVKPSKACKGTKWNKTRFSHKIFDRLLRKHVRRGKVNYNGFRRDRKKLNVYLCRLARTRATRIRGFRNRFAFWINAYNAVTIQAVLDRLPRSRGAQKRFSVAAKKHNFWKGWKYRVGKRWLTLDNIEHSILRPKYKDPRLHFAVVCASIGCPDLANRAYTGRNLYRLMTRNTRRYLASSRGFRRGKGNTIGLSNLFNWFAGDFARKPYKHRLLFVAKYAPKRYRRFLKRNHKSLKIKWLHYSWKLNVR